MKNGLSGHALNELDILAQNAKEKEKASKKLLKFKQIESERKAVLIIPVMNGYKTIFEAKCKKKRK